MHIFIMSEITHTVMYKRHRCQLSSLHGVLKFATKKSTANIPAYVGNPPQF